MVPIEELLAERAWLRRMTAQLLRDPHHAEDLAQETALSALRYGPARPQQLRGWLDRRHGERAAWLVPLAQLNGLGESSAAASFVTGSGALLMSKKLILVPVALVLVGLGLWWVADALSVEQPSLEPEELTSAAPVVPRGEETPRDAESRAPGELAAQRVVAGPKLEDARGGIRIVVLGRRSDAPVAGVGVLCRRAAVSSSLVERQERTDLTGTAEFGELEPGHYVLSTSHSSHVVRALIKPNATNSLRIRVAGGVEVEIQVVDGEGRAIANAAVLGQSSDVLRRSFELGRTGPDGILRRAHGRLRSILSSWRTDGRGDSGRTCRDAVALRRPGGGLRSIRSHDRIRGGGLPLLGYPDAACGECSGARDAPGGRSLRGGTHLARDG